MRRFLCLSLSLGVLVSACKKKFTQEDLDRVRAECKSSGGSGGGGGGTSGTTTIAKKDKAAVIKACLPLINNMLLAVYGVGGGAHLYLRRNTIWTAGVNNPTVLIYVTAGTPHVFGPEDRFGLGASAADVTRNLNAMAASTLIQGQFVARADDAPGYRIHLSFNTHNTNIPGSNIGVAPAAPAANTGLTIYDRESLAIDNRGHNAVAPHQDLRAANSADTRIGWYDCVLDAETQGVSLMHTLTPLTAA